MMNEDIMYGCINEDEVFISIGPRMISGDKCRSLAMAFVVAMDMLESGTKNVAICRCKYYGEDGNGAWGEIQGEGQISIDASYVKWMVKEEV